MSSGSSISSQKEWLAKVMVCSLALCVHYDIESLVLNI